MNNAIIITFLVYYWFFPVQKVFRRLTIILFIALLGISCGQDKNKQDAEAFVEAIENIAEDTTVISNEIIEKVLEQIPSPMEMSMKIRESGMDYDNSILSSSDDHKIYIDNYKQALNLGIYGSDLLYTNTFGMQQDGLGYIKAIKSIADEMSIGHFFDLSLLLELATSGDNKDSLITIIVKNSNDIIRYLQKQKRANLSALFLTGGWLEATHINCAMAINQPGNKMLEEKIGDQKIILESIMILLEHFAANDANIAQLHEDMLLLKNAFDEVEITDTYIEPTYEVVDGTIILTDHSTSTVEITHEDIETIHSILVEIRKAIQA